MPSVDLVGERLVIHDTEYRDREACRIVPGSSFRDGVWSAPVSWAAMKVIRSLWPNITVSQRALDWAWKDYHDRVAPTIYMRNLALDPAEHLPSAFEDMYPYQTTGSNFLAVAGQAILADEMGTGKTVQAIATIELLIAYPTLVICPNSAKMVWFREFERWAPDRTVQVIGGSVAQRRKQIAVPADVYVINFESLRTHTRLAPYGSTTLSDTDKALKELNNPLLPWEAVIVDEAHRIVDPHAKQTKAVWECPRTHTIGLHLQVHR